MKIEMQKQIAKIPLDVQLQAICQPSLSQSYDLLVSYLPELEEWNPRLGSCELFKERVKRHLTFSASDLIEYLQTHPDICTKLILDSYDKRFTPSTFIEEWQNDQYRVGWVTSGGDPLITQIRVFSSISEAAADYVLFSWDFPRLTKEQANWFDMERY